MFELLATDTKFFHLNLFTVFKPQKAKWGRKY